jgi:hypothetical protein
MKKAIISMLLPLTALACGGGDANTDETPGAETAAEAETAAGTVTIVTPTNGALINGSTVTVQLSSTVQILPAGDLSPSSGHHHLYLDADLTGATEPVPTVPGSIIHMGDASSTFVFEDVPPGEHRLIAVVADGVHVPLQPWVVDTVTFTVAN